MSKSPNSQGSSFFGFPCCCRRSRGNVTQPTQRKNSTNSAQFEKKRNDSKSSSPKTSKQNDDTRVSSTKSVPSFTMSSTMSKNPSLFKQSGSVLEKGLSAPFEVFVDTEKDELIFNINHIHRMLFKTDLKILVRNIPKYYKEKCPKNIKFDFSSVECPTVDSLNIILNYLIKLMAYGFLRLTIVGFTTEISTSALQRLFSKVLASNARGLCLVNCNIYRLVDFKEDDFDELRRVHGGTEDMKLLSLISTNLDTFDEFRLGDEHVENIKKLYESFHAPPKLNLKGNDFSEEAIEDLSQFFGSIDFQH